jgi:hypothetical protein
LKVSFDFDGTLQREDVQEYAKELMSRGIDVWVTTTRYDEANKDKYYRGVDTAPFWKVIKDLNIPHEKVHFTNMEWKCTYLPGQEFLWHLDDNYEELLVATTTLVDQDAMPYMIFVDEINWKEQCEGLIKKYENKNMSHK